MKSATYLMTRLDVLIKKFPDIKCSYKYDKDSNTHVIEILPDVMYSLCEEYAQVEEDIIFDFMSFFPTEGICFISENSLIKMTDPSYVISGKRYEVAEAEPWFVIEKFYISHQALNVFSKPENKMPELQEYEYANAA